MKTTGSPQLPAHHTTEAQNKEGGLRWEPAPSDPPPCCPQPQSPSKSPRLTSCEQNLVFPLLFYFLKRHTSSPWNSTSYLPRVPRGTLSFGARGAAGLPGPGGMRVPHRGHPTCPELSSCLLLKATFRFGVTLNCRRSHVSCLLPRERGAGRTHMGSLSPQFPRSQSKGAAGVTGNCSRSSHPFLVCNGLPKAGRRFVHRKSIREKTNVIFKSSNNSQYKTIKPQIITSHQRQSKPEKYTLWPQMWRCPLLCCSH